MSCVSCEGPPPPPPPRARFLELLCSKRNFSRCYASLGLAYSSGASLDGLSRRIRTPTLSLPGRLKQLTRGSGSVSDTRVSLRRLLSNVQAEEQPPEPLQPQCGRSFPF